MSDQGQLHRKSPIFGKVPEALMHDLTITDGAVRLYAHMHWRYGRNRQFFEKLQTIAGWLGISERAVRDRILELESADWVVVINRRNPHSHTARVNKYHVFEDKQDARDFRAAPFGLDELDNIRPKTEATPRKGRAGHGGKPAHKAASDGNQVPLGNRNSGSNGEGDVNRNSGSKELEALKNHTQKHISAPTGAPSSPDEPTPSPAPAPKAGKSRNPKPDTDPVVTARNKAIGDYISVWKEATKVIDPVAHGKKVNRDMAGALYDAGITAEDIKDFCHYRATQDDFWKGKSYPFTAIGQHYQAWRDANPNYHAPTAAQLAMYEEERQIMADYEAEMQRIAQHVANNPPPTASEMLAKVMALAQQQRKQGGEADDPDA